VSRNEYPRVHYGSCRTESSYVQEKEYCVNLATEKNAYVDDRTIRKALPAYKDIFSLRWKLLPYIILEVLLVAAVMIL